MSQPNIIVFVADDLGWGDLGCYGARKIQTPHIDSLAAEGRIFTDAHASSAVCTPSRYSLMTGEYPWRSPLERGVLGGTDPSIIRNGQPTLAHVMKRAGYRTAAFGKWHLGMDWVQKDGRRKSAFEPGVFRPQMEADGRDIDYGLPVANGPIDHGFDTFFGIAGSLDMPPYCFIEKDRTVGVPSIEKEPLVTSQRPGLQVPGWQDDQVDIAVCDRTVKWIEEADDRPFFAYIASAAPHRPCVPPEFLRGKSEAGPRGDSVMLVDWMVAEIVSALRASGQWDNTYVFFTSDNGAPMIFPEDGDVVEHAPNGPWRGQKGDAWEGGHRVPLVVKGPSVREGTCSNAVVSLIDILPTISGLIGLGDLPGGDGTRIPLDDPAEPTIERLVQDEPAEYADRVIGQQAFNGMLSLRRGSEKAIFGDGSGGFSDPVGSPAVSEGQYFNLESDPGETANQWQEQPDAAQAMLRDFTTATGLTLDGAGYVHSAAEEESARWKS